MASRPTDQPAQPAGLAPVHQQMIGQDTGHHRLAHRHRADTNARVMPSLGDQINLFAPDVYRLAWRQDR